VSRDSALDQLAFAVGYRLMTPAERRALRISAIFEMGEKAPPTPELAVLWDEDRLLRGEREPVNTYDHWTLMKAREEAERPAFDHNEARDVIAATRRTLGNPTCIGFDEGDHDEAMEQQDAA
jgi:hypothetical protein